MANMLELNHTEKRAEKSSYPLPPPNATHESARLNIQHALSLADLNGALLLSSLPSDGVKKVADIGSGTGIWAIDFATRYPSAQVFGFDLAVPPGFSESAPANAHFFVHDVEKPWPETGPGSGGDFDLVHGRQILLNLRNPKEALKRVYENLRPGGVVEFREFWNPMCSELENTGKVPLLVEWHQGTVDAAAALGCDHGFASQLPEAMEEAGFVDVQVSDRKVPIGAWTLDGRERQDERTARMDALLREMIQIGALGMTREMFVKALGWEEGRAVEYAQRVVRELEREDLGKDRIYARFRIVWARKPS